MVRSAIIDHNRSFVTMSTELSVETSVDELHYSNVIMAGYLVSAVFFIMTLRYV